MSLQTVPYKPYYKNDWWPLILKNLDPPELLRLARVDTYLHNFYSNLPDWELFLARDFAYYTSKTKEAANNIEFGRIKCIALNYLYNLGSVYSSTTQIETFIPRIQRDAQIKLKMHIPWRIFYNAPGNRFAAFTGKGSTNHFYCFYKTIYERLEKSAEFKSILENPPSGYLPPIEAYEHAYSATTPVLHLEWIKDLRKPSVFRRYYQLLGIFRHLVPAVEEDEIYQQSILYERYLNTHPMPDPFSAAFLCMISEDDRSIKRGKNRSSDPDSF